MPPPQANVYAEAPGQSCRGCSEKPRPALLLIKMGIPLTDLPECDSIQAWKTLRILTRGVITRKRFGDPLWSVGAGPQKNSPCRGV